MKKNLLVVMMMLVMVFGLVGCGKDENKSTREKADDVEVIYSVNEVIETEQVSSEHGKVVREEHITFEKVGDEGPQVLNSEIKGEFRVGAYSEGVAHFYEYEDGYIEIEVDYK